MTKVQGQAQIVPRHQIASLSRYAARAGLLLIGLASNEVLFRHAYDSDSLGSQDSDVHLAHLPSHLYHPYHGLLEISLQRLRLWKMCTMRP